MGIKELTQVIETHAPSAIENISLNSLRGKVIAVDAHIVLYQFLSVGQKDRVTLLLGLFHRVANLLGLGIKLVFVFDGQPPAIKQNELMRRAEQYAPTVSTAHIKDSQALLDMIGVPYIVAPAEAEAQCVHLVKLGVCDAVASEDLDTLPYGGEILLRHLKEPGQTQPTQINLSKVLQQMNLKMSSFVDLCILLGCDFVDKIPSVGKVKALSLLKEYGSIENILSNTHYSELVDRDWIECVQKARNEFIRPCVQDQARPPWGAVKKEQLLQHLCGELGASVEQIKKKLTLISTHGIENVAAVFLEQNLFADYTRFYKPEMKEIFESFMENYPIALRFPFNEFAQHCQSRRLLHIQRSDLVFKPRYIKKQLGLYRVYAVSAGVFLGRESFYACDICEKGFPSRNACKSHNTSSDHLQQVKRLVHKLGGKKYKTYFCSQLHCDQSFDSVTKYTHHLTHEKWLRVEMIPPPVLTPQDHSDDVETGFWCEDCNVQTTCAVSMAQHKKGKRHKRNVLKNLYLSHRDVLRETRANVKIYCEQEDQNVVTLAYERGRSQKITLVVKNESQEVDLELLTAHSINTWVNVTISLGSPVRIKPSDKKAVELTVRPQHYGRSELAVLFVVCQGGTSFLVSKEVTLKCVSNSAIFHQLKPSEPYQKIKRKKAASCDIIHSDSKPDIETSYALERTIELADYFIPPLVKKLLFQFTFSAGKAADGYESIIEELSLSKLDFPRYSVYLNNLLYLEEEQMKVDIGHYTLEEVSMRLDSRTGLFRLTVPGLAENRPSVLRGDRVFVSPLPICGQKYEGYVHNVTLTELFLGFNKRLSKMYIANMRFRVEFTINRLSLKLEHRAVSWAGAHSDLGLEKVLFPAAQDRIPPFLPLLQTDLRCYERKVENNNEQLKAVLHIVCGTSRPSPYLIYGPPGTGKSFTLVEAIKQVFNRFKESHILVCAPQNAAADLLAGRLLDHIPKDAILRLNALSRAYGDIERKVQEVSNYKSVSGVASRAVRHGLSGKSKQGDMQVEYPNKDVLKKKRVIVSTLVTSGRLVSADLSSHFTHIFIDEAGHATEPETVIPLAGLLDTQMANGGQVVLAGDPQQLGPIIRSNIASDRGLGQSLLERYMSMELYSRGLSGEFNPDYVTKLVRSFRSHPDILEVPNTCFYDNELIAHADKMQRERFCNWEGLPRKGFPLIFHGVNGEEEQEGNSPSWFNRFEVMQLILYLEKLFECKSPKIKPEHIGIITPYHKQAIKIQQALKALEVSHKGHMKNFAQIKVGSVEKFQGDEREVIIISTVRSQDVYLTHDKKFNLGFVRNPKRFNVAVTRAKAMLIIIGNPAVLSKDASWLSLLTFIEEGGGYVGCPLTEEDIEEDEDDLNSLQEKFELMKIKADEVSEGLLVGDQEWHRKE